MAMDQKVQIKASDEDLKGRYANIVMVSHTKEEFVLDFIQNALPAAQLISRMVVHPGHAKRILHALNEQVKQYEKTFGELEAVAPNEAQFGFRNQAL